MDSLVLRRLRRDSCDIYWFDGAGRNCRKAVECRPSQDRSPEPAFRSILPGAETDIVSFAELKVEIFQVGTPSSAFRWPLPQRLQIMRRQGPFSGLHPSDCLQIFSACALWRSLAESNRSLHRERVAS
jgi:hypothetical protein